MGCVLAAALLVAALVADGAEAAPAISFEPTAVNVTGMTPQGRAFVFGVLWKGEGGGVKASRHTTFLSDGDGDGQSRLDLGDDMPKTSVWLVVDFESGEWTVATGGVVREAPFPWNAVAYSRDRLSFGCERAYLVVVRPKTGAWVLRTQDGSATDADGDNNGAIRAELASFSAFGGSPPPPAKLEPGDVILVVDAERALFGSRTLAR
jgi:hypothetical protein